MKESLAYINTNVEGYTAVYLEHTLQCTLNVHHVVCHSVHQGVQRSVH